MTLVSESMRHDVHLQNAAQNSPPLRHGAHNSGVQIMQRCLIQQGYAMPVSTNQGSSQPDGIFGSETANVVRQFQRDQGLASDGIAGRDTLHALDRLMQQVHVEKPAPSKSMAIATDMFHWRMCAKWT